MSELEVLLIAVVVLCVLYLLMRFAFLHHFVVADDCMDDEPDKTLDNVLSDVIETNEVATAEDSEDIHINYEKNVSDESVTLNVPLMLDGFVKSYVKKAEYDKKRFDYPKILNDIDIKTASNECWTKNSKYNDWHKDSHILRIVASKMLQALAVDLRDHHRVLNPGIMAFIDKFMKHYKYTYNHGNSRPWGSDDIGFIEMTYLLAIYMVSKYPTAVEREELAKTITSIIPKPNFVFKTAVPFVNIIYTSTPWILANTVLKRPLTSHDIKTIKTVALRRYNDIPRNGFHIDRSFTFNGAFDFSIPNKMCIKYKYELLELLVDEFKDSTLLTLPKATRNLNDFIIHPKIKVAMYNVNVFDANKTKLTSLEVFNVPENNYGIRVMPLAKLLRLFTCSHAFAVRGITPKVKYVPEAKLTNSDQNLPMKALKLMQKRKILNVHDTPESIAESNNNFGVIAWVNQDDNVNIMMKNMLSVVGMYNKIGMFYQMYEVFDAPIGSYQVKELITIHDTEDSQTLNFTIQIMNLAKKRHLTYCGYAESKLLNTNRTDKYFEYSTPFTLEPGITKTFTTKLAINHDVLSIVEPTREIRDNYALSFPIFLNNNLTINNMNHQFTIVKEPDMTKVYCPSSEMNVQIGDKFRFNTDTNQWVYR